MNHLEATGDAPPPEPPLDRPTKMRWGCLLYLVVGGVFVLVMVVPPLGGDRMPGHTTAAALQASYIFRAAMLYAQDHNGKFPTGEANSNQAFRQLFPMYIEDEKWFFVENSAWHDAAPGKRPDDEIGTPPDYSKCLERGENHWAYVSGLNDTSGPLAPIIASGFVENEPGTYTDNPRKKGGVWKGSTAIVVFIDGAAVPTPLSAKTHFRVLRTVKGQSIDIFTREGGLPEGARVLNPE